MRFDHLKSLYLSGAVFLVLFTVGFLLSERKVIWGDEFYTQYTAIEGNSYGNILTLKFPDGNKNPLFYFLQKTVCDLFSFHMPADLFNLQTRKIRYMPGQVILRIPSNVYMSLALALIFYFFTRFYSLSAAFYALIVALVSPMVWTYWVEARPYPLWFLLTTIQLLLLAFVIITNGAQRVKSFILVHVLLALTTPACIFQISIVALMLFWRGRYSFKQLGFVWILPTVIAFFYYCFDRTSTIKTYLFTANLFDVVMPEHLFIYVLYALGAWVLPEKYKKSSWNLFFLPVFLMFLASAVFVLFVDLFTQNSGQGFFSRYLIYVTPADILMFSLASLDLFRWSRPSPWVCLNVSVLLGGLVIIRGLMTYRSILGAALYLHSPG